MSVYDDQNKDLNSLSPHEISELEDGYSTPQDEDRKAESEADNEAEKQDEDLKNRFDNAREKDEGSGESFYKPSGTKKGGLKGSLAGYGKKKAIWGAAGGGLFGIIMVIAALLGFLNVFKLDHLMQNIESKSFIRYLAASDGRSEKWTRAYIQLRLMEIDGNSNDNPLFRANNVDNDNPVRDWYRTMRTSSFEKDLAKKGIRFTNEAAVGGRSFVVLRVDGEKVAGLDNSDFRDGSLDAMIRKGEISSGVLNKIDIDKAGGSKAARAEIKKAVNENTHWWQVMKRRHVRKDIQNMTGIKEWRFFEKTRDKVDTTKINVRNKIIIKALPENTKSGKFIQCIFGITDCKKASTDPPHPDNRAGVTVAASTCEGSKDPQCQTKTGTDKNGDPINQTNPLTAQDGLSSGIANDAGEDIAGTLQVKIVKELLSKFSGPVSIISFFDTLFKVDENVRSGSLVKMVYMARATQAIGMFTTYSIARDQLKTGEVTRPEVDEFMTTINAVSNSEGWTSVVGSSSNAKAEGFTAAKNKEEYCSEHHQDSMLLPENKKAAEREFHYLCDNEKIGSADTATTIQNGWNSTVGTILSPLFAAYKGTGLSSVVGFVNGLFEATIGKLLSSVLTGVLNTLGLGDNIKDLMSWVAAKAASILGAGPAMSGQEASGVFFNHILMGGAATNSASMRYQGAAKTTSETKLSAVRTVDSYKRDVYKNENIIERYASLSNPNSIASTVTFSFANTVGSQKNLANTVGSLFGSIKSSVLSIFSFSSKAATSPYAADEFSGVESYDFPKECLSLDPLKATRKNVTNIQQVLGLSKAPDTEITWNLLTNKEAWYDYIYSKTDNDDIAKKIYNCALLDTSIRGGLGAIYGYTNDGGLDSGTPEPDDTGLVVTGDWTWPVKTPVSISSCFAEPLSKGPHPGLDISVSYVPAYASASGKVYGTPGGEWGILIIQHSNGLYSVYEHMSKITVSSGQQVNAGDPVGTTGNTAPPGGSSGPHLHFGITTDPTKFEYADMGSGKIQNPLIYINDGKDYGGCSISPRSS